MAPLMCKAVIRTAQPEDIIGLREVELAGFIDPWGEETIRQELANKDRTHYVVAEVENQIIGYAGLWVIFDEGHITRVAVYSGFRRRGIGRDMVKALMDKAYSLGCKSFTLEVRASNMEAMDLYKSMGFEVFGARPGYYEVEGEAAVIMWYNPPEYIVEGTLNEGR